jgi:hypothetical protein
MFKVCIICCVEKPKNEFNTRKDSKDGYRNNCKKCLSEKGKKYYKENMYDINKRNNKYHKENHNLIQKQRRKYREKNSEKIKESSKQYYQENKEIINEKSNQYYQDNIENIKERSNQYYQKNKKTINKYHKEYYSINKESILKQVKEYRLNNKEYIYNLQKKKHNNNPHVRTWRNILKNTLNRMDKEKSSKTIDMLGYSPEDLKIHMESLFSDGMCWENHGEWHIDHKIPINAFNKDTSMDIVNSLDNLQPLWASDNLSKSDKVFEEFKEMEIYKLYCNKKV